MDDCTFGYNTDFRFLEDLKLMHFFEWHVLDVWGKILQVITMSSDRIWGHSIAISSEARKYDDLTNNTAYNKQHYPEYKNNNNLPSSWYICSWKISINTVKALVRGHLGNSKKWS